MARLPADLDWIPEFKQTELARACERPSGAYANCLAVSVRCVLWLRERGIGCGLLHLAGRAEPFRSGTGRWPLIDPAATNHWTVRAGDWSIDWTARQFRPWLRLPLVEHVDTLAASWLLVEDWACPRCESLFDDPLHVALTPPGLDREHRRLARESGGLGPFPDPRHDDTPPLTLLCTHGPAPAVDAAPWVGELPPGAAGPPPADLPGGGEPAAYV